MLMVEAYARERSMGQSIRVVRQVRRKMNKVSIEEMADMFDITPAECEAVVDLIQAHPDWDNEQIAEEVEWEE